MISSGKYIFLLPSGRSSSHPAKSHAPLRRTRCIHTGESRLRTFPGSWWKGLPHLSAFGSDGDRRGLEQNGDMVDSFWNVGWKFPIQMLVSIHHFPAGWCSFVHMGSCCSSIALRKAKFIPGSVMSLLSASIKTTTLGKSYQTKHPLK